MLDVLHGHVLDIEPNIVSGNSFGQRLVVHLDRLYFSRQLVGGEGYNNSGLDDSSLHSTHRHCANTSNFVDILKGKSERLVSGPGGRNDGIKSVEQGCSASLALLPLDVPALVPAHVGGGLQHVVAVPAGDGHKGDSRWVVSDLLDEASHLLGDLLEPGLAIGRLSGVHLVDGDNELLDSQSVGQEGVLPGLPVLGDTSFKFSSSSSDDQTSAVSLRSSCDHVLDKITMSRSVDDGDI